MFAYRADESGLPARSLLAPGGHDDLARTAGVAVLAEVDALPGAQSDPPARDRDGDGRTEQRGLDVRGHVVGALERVRPVVGVLGDGGVDPGPEVAADRRARVLVQRQGRRGVADEHVRDPRLEALELGNRTDDLVGDEVEAARPRLEPQLPL